MFRVAHGPRDPGRPKAAPFADHPARSPPPARRPRLLLADLARRCGPLPTASRPAQLHARTALAADHARRHGWCTRHHRPPAPASASCSPSRTRSAADQVQRADAALPDPGPPRPNVLDVLAVTGMLERDRQPARWLVRRPDRRAARADERRTARLVRRHAERQHHLAPHSPTRRQPIASLLRFALPPSGSGRPATGRCGDHPRRRPRCPSPERRARAELVALSSLFPALKGRQLCSSTRQPPPRGSASRHFERRIPSAS